MYSFADTKHVGRSNLAITAWEKPSEVDFEGVARLLGRSPEGLFQVVARCKYDNAPGIVACWPIIAPTTPMPTLFWLLDPHLTREVSMLESRGIVKEVRAAVDHNELQRVHDKCAMIRDKLIPDRYLGPRPTGGIGGTRGGFKCMHAHLAWYLVSGDDPAVSWTLKNYPGSITLDRLEITELPPGLEMLMPN